MTAENARVLVEVTAGLIPGTPDQQFTKRFAITSKQWDESEDKYALLAITNGEALGYAALLMIQPERLNWVRTDWIWL